MIVKRYAIVIPLLLLFSLTVMRRENSGSSMLSAVIEKKRKQQSLHIKSTLPFVKYSLKTVKKCCELKSDTLRSGSTSFAQTMR